MKKIGSTLLAMSAVLAPLALELAHLTANATCFYLSYQPEEPANLKEMIARQAKNKK